MDYVAKLRELEECYFGTIVSRDEETGGKLVEGRDGVARPEVNRPRHAHNGWREGHSKPFMLGDKTYDRDLDSMVVTNLTFQRLKAAIEAKILLLKAASGESVQDDDLARAKKMLVEMEKRGVKLS